LWSRRSCRTTELALRAVPSEIADAAYFAISSLVWDSHLNRHAANGATLPWVLFSVVRSTSLRSGGVAEIAVGGKVSFRKIGCQAGGRTHFFRDGNSHGSSRGKYSHRILTGIGHDVPQEAPQAFAQAVVDIDGS
jgi:hypothetical protein